MVRSVTGLMSPRMSASPIIPSRLSRVRRGATSTIVLVSHALGTIADLCDAAVWMHKGVLQMEGEPQAVIDAYTQFLEVGEDALTMEDM